MNERSALPGAYPAARQRVGIATAAALLLPATLSGLAMTGLNPVIPQIEQAFAQFPYASVLARFLVTAISLSMIVGAPLAGFLGSRFGQRRTMIWGTFLYGVSGCAGLFLDSLPALVFTRILLGLSMATVGTMITTLITLYFPESERPRWLGFYSLTGILFVLVALPLAGLVGTISWRAPFALHAVAFPLLLLFLFALPHEERKPPLDPLAPPTLRTGLSPAFVLFAVLNGSLASGALLFLPFRIVEIGVHSADLIAFAMLPQVAGAGLTAFMFGRIRQHVSQRATFIISFLVFTTGLMIATIPSYWVMILGLCLSGLGAGLFMPNMFALTATIGTEEDRSRNMGIVYGAFFAGPLLAQVLLEPIVQRTNAAAGLVGLAATSAVLALVHILRLPLARSTA